MINLEKASIAPAAVQDSFWILVHPQCILTKQWFYQGSQLTNTDYAKAFKFDAYEHSFTGIRELAEALRGLAGEPHAMVIRGEPLQGRGSKRENIQRTSRPQEGQPACFRDVPRRWVMLDFDNVQLPDVNFLEDPVAGVRAILATLPAYFRDVTCVYQMSASCGISLKKSGFSCHLWFFLDRPLDCKAWRRLAATHFEATGQKLCDTSLFKAVQPHYTADPIVGVGVKDPFAGRRVGLVEGAKDLVAPPSTMGNSRADSWRRKLAEIHAPQALHHEIIRDTAYAYFIEHGHQADAAMLTEVMSTEIEIARIEREDDPVPPETLAEYIESGRRAAKDRGVAGDNLKLAPDGSPLPVLGNCMALLRSHPDWQGVLSYNTRTLQVILQRKPPLFVDAPGNYPRPFSNNDARYLAEWFTLSVRCAITKGIASDAAASVAEQNAFDPVADYLNALEWDGKPRIDTWAIRHFGADDTEYTRKVSRLWMISAVARALEPGCQVDTTLILEGPQGYGKTQFLRLLAGREHMSDQLPDISSKDAKIHVHGPWVIEIAELVHFQGKDSRNIKSFLTSPVDCFRAPYAAIEERHERKCVFVGTTNEAQYLDDPTGARRFWPITVRKQVDLHLVALERDQLWAEAAFLFRSGEKWYQREADSCVTAQQDARRQVDEWEEAIVMALQKGACTSVLSAPATEKIIPNAPELTISQVAEHVFNIPIDKLSRPIQIRIGNTLRCRLKYSRHRVMKNGAQIYVYCKN